MTFSLHVWPHLWYLPRTCALVLVVEISTLQPQDAMNSEVLGLNRDIVAYEIKDGRIRACSKVIEEISVLYRVFVRRLLHQAPCKNKSYQFVWDNEELSLGRKQATKLPVVFSPGSWSLWYVVIFFHKVLMYISRLCTSCSLTWLCRMGVCLLTKVY